MGATIQVCATTGSTLLREEERVKRSLNQNTQSPSLSLQDTNCCMGTEFANLGPSFTEGECLPGPLVSYKPERDSLLSKETTPHLCLSKTELLPPYVLMTLGLRESCWDLWGFLYLLLLPSEEEYPAWREYSSPQIRKLTPQVQSFPKRTKYNRKGYRHSENRVLKIIFEKCEYIIVLTAGVFWASSLAPRLAQYQEETSFKLLVFFQTFIVLSLICFLEEAK